jgi:hypothetical protein
LDIKTNVLNNNPGVTIVKRSFESKKIYVNNHLDWLADSFMNPDHMSSWKSSLREVKTIETRNINAESRVFFEKHVFNGEIELGYIYKR